MRAPLITRGRGVYALLAVAVSWGCADESDPAYQAEQLEDPVETENALERLRKMLDERLQLEDKAQALAVADYASRATDGLVGAYKRAEGNPLVQTRVISVLTRIIGYTTNPGLRKKVVNEVFLPALDRFKDRGEDPAQASLIVDTLAGLMKPPVGDKPLLDAGEIETAVTKLRDVSQAVRQTWGCKERMVRMQGRESPVADQEQLLLSCIQGTAQLMASDIGKAAQNAGVPVLLDALRESFFFQDFYLNRAAADALDEIAPFLTPDFVRQVAPALVEGLFMQGDFFLFPYARRALVHIAALSPENRDIVIEELLRTINVDMDEAVAAKLPELAGLGKNDRIDLMRLPCGSTLSVSCVEKEGLLREYRDKAWAPGRAACNKGADPDRPGSGFQWGFNYEVIWDKFGSLLVDIITPLKPGTEPDKGTKAGLALSVLQLEVQLTDEWVSRIKQLKKLHEAIGGYYEEFMSSRAASAEAAAATGTATAEAAPAEERVPEPSSGIDEPFEALKTLRDAGQKVSADVEQATYALLEALKGDDAKSSDMEACQALVKGVFTDLQNELLMLADFDHEYGTVNLRLWRTLTAARSLGLLGVTGANDETLRRVMRITQFSLDNLMGFRVTPLKAFPQMVLRFKQRFTAEGMPMVAQPAIPGFMDAVQSFQRPTPEVMNFLLHMMAASALTGENQNSTVRQEQFFMLNADVTTFRALAARTFFAIFRQGEVLPDAAQYLDLFNFYTGDLQYLLALEKTTDNNPAFQLYPPIVKPVEGAPAEAGEGDWLATRPEKSALFTFETYRDPLMRCIIRDIEDKQHVAKWRREMNDDQKTEYCKKWVEPFASQNAREMAAVEVAKLTIDDERCWTHMKNVHEAQFEYCLDVENNRTPKKELNLSKEQCKEIKDKDDDYLYCVDLRFLPQYLETNMPTLWGCYDEFPWLRSREPFGPECGHLAGRMLAAYLYVKLRSAAGIAAPDGVTFDKLNGILSLPEYLNFTKTFGAEQNEELFRKVDLLSQELAKVQGDFPVFQRPRSENDRKSKVNVKRPEDVDKPYFVETPWYWHDEMVAREPRSFDDLRKVFLESCRPEDDETGTECAKDGGKLGNQMKITVEGGAPGPLMEDAAGLAIMLMRQDLVGIGEMRDALNTVESQCAPGGSYNMGCLREAALNGANREQTVFVNPSCRGLVLEALGCVDDPEMPGACAERRASLEHSICSKFFEDVKQARGIDNLTLNQRVRALYLLSALADQDRATAESAVGDLLLTVDSDPRFMPPVTFALQKIRPPCCAPGEANCGQLGCERVRLFAQYWNTQPIRDNQVPDIDALYYMLLASR
ncbi:MAG: hypothetical protein JXB32_13455 [Deltaproteobacteria bacterium]|nr:hypothetical protein [Deltaproteobacteria bacterium]